MLNFDKVHVNPSQRKNNYIGFLKEKQMQIVKQLGQTKWSKEDLSGKLEEFSKLYQEKPFHDNEYGMKSPHMFYMWFTLQHLKPKIIIESGVYRGLGTWFIEQACPNAELYCIDINLSNLQYRSPNATYLDEDFKTLDWTELPKNDTIIFFDDHQNAYERLKTMKWFGFKRAIFEDNYPPGQGDCFSLKKALNGEGHTFKNPTNKTRFLNAIRIMRGRELSEIFRKSDIPSNSVHLNYIKQNLEIYYEFPPIFKNEKTRWQADWSSDNYFTPDPLFNNLEEDYHKVYQKEAQSYTWMCYVELK